MAKNDRRDRHHRKPRSIGGDNEGDNISLVSPAKHSAWHLLFANHPAEEIARTINQTWLDQDYVMIAVKIGKENRERIHEVIRAIAKSIP